MRSDWYLIGESGCTGAQCRAVGNLLIYTLRRRCQRSQGAEYLLLCPKLRWKLVVFDGINVFCKWWTFVNIPSLGIPEMNNCGGKSVRLFHLFQNPERLHVDQWTINCFIKMDAAVKFYLKEKYSDSAEVFCFLWAPEIVTTVSWKCSMMLYFSQYISNIY